MMQSEEQRSRRLGRRGRNESASAPAPQAGGGPTSQAGSARSAAADSTPRPGQPPAGSRGTEPRGPNESTAASGAREKLSWIALTVAAVLAAWQIIYALTLQNMAEASQDVYTSVWLLVSLILAVGCAVLGIVAVSQRALPRWPATTALSIGAYVFLVSVASWIGELMASPM